MKLRFRGKSYESPHLEWDIQEGEVGGTYRGNLWRVHHLKEQHRRRHAQSKMTYRGIPYTKD